MLDSLTKLKVLQYYTRKFQRLRVDRAHGIAPHKPILLLSIIEMIANKEILENEIYLSKELNLKFLKYWSYLGSESHNPEIFRPYFHMRSGKFWHFIANPGFEKLVSSKIKLRTFGEVKKIIKYAYFDEDLFDFLRVDKYRNSLTIILISQWFPGRLEEILEIAKTNKFREPSVTMEKIKARLTEEKFI